MKRFSVCLIVLLVLLLLTSCNNKNNDKNYAFSSSYTAVEPVGQVPAEFRSIIQNNLFGDAAAFGDRLLRYDYTDDGYHIEMLSAHGELLATRDVAADHSVYRLHSLTTTSDGGFLFALGFYDNYVYDEGKWASEDGICSTVVKCNAGGELEWERQLNDYEGMMLYQCIENGDAYYFFGKQQTPETKSLGSHSATDIHLMKMSKAGEVLLTDTIGGSDFDSLYRAEKQGESFLLYCRAQSSDGDFSSAGDWKIVVDTELGVQSMKKSDHAGLVDAVGILDGVQITNENEIFDDFQDGRVTALIDYGDYYLVVSENVTGIYEHTPPTISAQWYYTETVYGAYQKNGTLLWKATVDSSPDYMIRGWNTKCSIQYEKENIAGCSPFHHFHVNPSVVLVRSL